MKIIPRKITESVEGRLFGGKAILIYGPRQAGKTTLIKNLLLKKGEQVLSLNGDEPDIREFFINATSTKLRAIVGKKTILYIDEAQRISNIGLSLKLLVDEIKEVQVIASGSSSFELASKLAEPLTGRKYEYTLLPFAFQELVSHTSVIEEKRLLENRLIYGSYPEIVTHPGEEKELLHLLTESYLYKDILMLENITKPALIEKLVKALALQIGSEVSFNELAKTVGSDPTTVEKYIGILEKAYIVFQVPAFSKNIRTEIKKGKKIFFYDNGIRNAVIRNYQPLALRVDRGALWENYLMNERRKFLLYNQMDNWQYFWRSTQQQEIDSVEEANGKLAAYEFKWNPDSKVRIPRTFSRAYALESEQVVHCENYESFLLPTVNPSKEGGIRYV